MPELRRDPIIGRWVIIATDRAKRPDQLGPSTGSAAAEKEELRPGEKCPFCEGNESMTPPEICAVRPSGGAPNRPGWEVRVIPSISPLLRIEPSLDRHGHGMYDLMNARGAHEIVVQTPRHARETDLTVDEITKSINVILDRVTDLERDRSIKYALVFKNYGKAAGGGHIHHARIQIIGTPVNLKRVKEELTGARAYYSYRERCIFCDIIKQETAAGKRVIFENELFVAISPFASRFPFETWILPKSHSCDFYRMDRAGLPHLASVIKSVFGGTKSVIGDFPYNLVLHTAPFRRDKGKRGQWETIDSDYHWHLEILPILTRVAGFEWGSGFYINPLPPEEACRSVREAGTER